LIFFKVVSDGVAAQKSAPAGALAPVLSSSCLVKNLLSHHWSHFYQQLDSLFLQLEFFVFCGATWLRQDCARPAIASDFFQKSLAQGLTLLGASPPLN
jgi:hypothetical protein